MPLEDDDIETYDGEGEDGNDDDDFIDVEDDGEVDPENIDPEDLDAEIDKYLESDEGAKDAEETEPETEEDEGAGSEEEDLDLFDADKIAEEEENPDDDDEDTDDPDKLDKDSREVYDHALMVGTVKTYLEQARESGAKVERSMLTRWLEEGKPVEVLQDNEIYTSEDLFNRLTELVDQTDDGQRVRIDLSTFAPDSLACSR